MACARSKEVIELRIFGHSKLLVIMKSCSRIELNFFAKLIAGIWVFDFQVEV